MNVHDACRARVSDRASRSPLVVKGAKNNIFSLT